MGLVDPILTTVEKQRIREEVLDRKSWLWPIFGTHSDLWSALIFGAGCYLSRLGTSPQSTPRNAMHSIPPQLATITSIVAMIANNFHKPHGRKRRR